MSIQLSSTLRTTLRRHRDRACLDASELFAVLDACSIVHVGIAEPLVLPMTFGRIGDRLYLHGAVTNGLFAQAFAAGAEVCVSATVVDGLVVARSAFHHSMNYRSATIFGPLLEVEGDEKAAAARAILERALPGRALECRLPSSAELRATRFVALDLGEASVKIRRGPPISSATDDVLPFWSGVVGLASQSAHSWSEGDGEPPPSVCRAILDRVSGLTGQGAVDDFVISGDPRRVDLDVVLRWLRDDSYWASDLTLARLLRSIQGSYPAGVYDSKGVQVAFARVITDKQTFAWLADVFVARDLRGRGIGSALVRWLVEHSELRGLRRWLLGTKDAQALYQPFDFEPIESAPSSPTLFMQRRRRDIADPSRTRAEALVEPSET